MKMRIYACAGSLGINALFLTLLLGATTSENATRQTTTSTVFDKAGPQVLQNTPAKTPFTSHTHGLTPQPLGNIPPLLESSKALKNSWRPNASLSLPHYSKQKLAYKESAVDHRPKLMERVTPAYPTHAREQGIEGYVEYKILINAHGIVDGLSLIDAKPAGYFEESCKKALTQFKFRPAQKDGQAVPVMIKQKFNFNLEE